MEPQEKLVSIKELDFLDVFAHRLTNKIYALPVFQSKYTPLIATGTMAMVCVIMGASFTKNRPRNGGVPNEDKESPDWDPTDNDNSLFTVTQQAELELGVLNSSSTMELKHVLTMPLIAGTALVTLYTLLKKWNKVTLEWYMNWYFLFAGATAELFTFDRLLAYAVRRVTHLLGKNSLAAFTRYRLTLAKDVDHFPLGGLDHIDLAEVDFSNIKKKEVENKLTPEELNDVMRAYLYHHIEQQQIKLETVTPVSPQNQLGNFIFDLKFLYTLPLVALTSWQFYKSNPSLNPNYVLSETNWLISNLFGVCFAIFGIATFRIPNFKLAFALLIGLFFYDIYFVFGTEVMTSVATGLKVPIKLSFPSKAGDEIISTLSPPKMVMLGLGDIVIPGAIIALALRFDINKHCSTMARSFHHNSKAPKPYFLGAVSSYLCGLIFTFFALHKFNVAQPALLYIVPCLILGIAITGVSRREINELFYYDENISPFDPSFDNKSNDHNVVLNTDIDDDQDDDFICEESDGSYDNWEDLVEMKRARLDGDPDVDDVVDTLHSRGVPSAEVSDDIGETVESGAALIYQFGDTDDEDDDTYAIHSDNSDASLSDDESVISLDDIATLRNDARTEPHEWYSDIEDR